MTSLVLDVEVRIGRQFNPQAGVVGEDLERCNKVHEAIVEKLSPKYQVIDFSANRLETICSDEKYVDARRQENLQNLFLTAALIDLKAYEDLKDEPVIITRMLVTVLKGASKKDLVVVAGDLQRTMEVGLKHQVNCDGYPRSVPRSLDNHIRRRVLVSRSVDSLRAFVNTEDIKTTSQGVDNEVGPMLGFGAIIV